MMVEEDTQRHDYQGWSMGTSMISFQKYTSYKQVAGCLLLVLSIKLMDIRFPPGTESRQIEKWDNSIDIFCMKSWNS
ncbi:unnamed protein product [Allacma fusca]|uniref:Uncharacterized protein n=1 Tax=Allacma fusca TaxID=39272 RepID=A0A8J2PJE8_9HEXA|nr:unnamed protein product [Allacma fusca]